jgi:hypothetical protein
VSDRKRGVLTFKQTDVERAIRAARDAGMNNPVIEITRSGCIKVYEQSTPDKEEGDTWADL